MIVTGWKRKPTGMGKSAIQLDITGSYISISLRFVCPVLFSGMVELLQEYCTTYRGGDWLDFAANTTGAVLASMVGYFILRPRMK